MKKENQRRFPTFTAGGSKVPPGAENSSASRIGPQGQKATWLRRKSAARQRSSALLGAGGSVLFGHVNFSFPPDETY
jgi:hypothetical protein